MSLLRMSLHGQKQLKMLLNNQKHTFFIMRMRSSCKAYVEIYLMTDVWTHFDGTESGFIFEEARRL